MSQASNLPGADAIFLDHVGHFVTEAQAAESALRALGFTCTPFSVQFAPSGREGALERTGTGNICVMLGAGYIEVLAHTADTEIGREFRRALARHSGLHLAAFAAADAAAHYRRLERDGFPLRPIVHMRRPIATETGEAEARFTVVRAPAAAMPEGRFQLLTHHTEAALWQARWLRHANGAVGLDGLLVLVTDPRETAERLARFVGRWALDLGDHYRIDLERGHVAIGDRAFGERMLPGLDADIALPWIAAYGVRVADLSHTRAFLARAGIDAAPLSGALRVAFPPALGRGYWLFADSGEALPWMRAAGSPRPPAPPA